MIAVVDYGVGNLRSVAKALESVGATVRVTADAADIAAAERIVLPGVGAFGDCVRSLAATGLIETLQREVLERKKPFLGICLGMEILARTSDERGRHEGLGWLAADVHRFPKTLELPVPHMGWNDVQPAPGGPLFRGLSAPPVYYFAHSYVMRCDDPTIVAASCEYGITFCAAFQWQNLVGVQFHPEKSQVAGLDLLQNFVTWSP